MRILVTGAGGFVGKTLVPYLVAEGHEVIAATRKPGQISDGIPIRIDAVGPETDWSQALLGVQTVVHLAARAHVLHEESSNPLAEHRRVNTEGTRRLAQQAIDAQVKRFVFMSSIGVLGNSSLNAKNGHSFTEEDEPKPHDDYSQSKWEAEQALTKMQGLEIVTIRPPLIYGPDVPGNFRRLLLLAKDGKPFPLGGIHNKRSLIGVRNLASIVSLCLKDPRAVGQTYVVADREQLSTAELYTQLCHLFQVNPRLINLPESVLRGMLTLLGKAKMADRLCDTLVVDASKIERDLGLTQAVTQVDGFRETVSCLLSPKT